MLYLLRRDKPRHDVTRHETESALSSMLGRLELPGGRALTQRIVDAVITGVDRVEVIPQRRMHVADLPKGPLDRLCDAASRFLFGPAGDPWLPVEADGTCQVLQDLVLLLLQRFGANPVTKLFGFGDVLIYFLLPLPELFQCVLVDERASI